MSDFETEAGSKDSMYNESGSDNSNSSEDDASVDDIDATASDSDFSSIRLVMMGTAPEKISAPMGEAGVEAFLEAEREGEEVHSRRIAGVKRGRVERGATGRRVKSGTGSSSTNLYVWTTVGESTYHHDFFSSLAYPMITHRPPV